ncbi:MAG: hypothetical protein AB1324_01020 [Candidatus Micrarchaeota archaeon]
MRKTGFAPAVDLLIYGFSARQAAHVMGALGSPGFERGELLRRLKDLERPRKLNDGFTSSLSRGEVIAFVSILPALLLQKPARASFSRSVEPVTDDERDDLNMKAKALMRSAVHTMERMKLLRASGMEWKSNPGLQLQREVGIEFC